MSAATHSEVAPENQHDGTVASDVDLTAGRRKVARSRGVLSGILLLLLGAWAALAPFIGPYFDFGFDPRAGDAFHWTSGRGLYEVLPGGVAALAGLVLLASASRVLTVLMAWLAALGGAWLVVAPSLAPIVGVEIGSPPGSAGVNKTVALSLLYFFATGAAIVLVAGIALGRLSVHSVRDVRAAERRAEIEAAAEAQRQEAQRIEAERRESDRLAAERHAAERQHADNATTPAAATAAATTPAATAPAATTPTAAHEAGTRDTAGSSSYGGHHADTATHPGAHAVGTDAASSDESRQTAQLPAHDPAEPPAPGATEQYRYGTTDTGTTGTGTTDTTAPPEERRT